MSRQAIGPRSVPPGASSGRPSYKGQADLPTPRHHRGGEQGFTLLETLVATTVLAIGIFGVISMVVFTSALERQARHITQAALLFEELMEGLMPLQDAPGDLASLDAPSGTMSRGGSTYEVRCSVEYGTPLDKCRELSCRISWAHNGKRYGSDHAYTFCPQ